MRDEYDIIVIGAGPGGSIAAWTAADECDVLLIEKRQEIYNPANGLDTTVPRHTEIKDELAYLICKQLGIPKIR